MLNSILKTKKMIGLTAIFIMIFSLCGLGIKPANAENIIQISSSQITLYNSEQLNPDIYQYGLNHFAVVWQDNRNGNWDIYMFFQKHDENGWDVQWDRQITANSGNNEYPKIYNDTIVYQSDRTGNWDIYMYNLTSNVETQITTNIANQGPCAIYGDIIVWQDWRNMWTPPYFETKYMGMDIYMYNLTSQTEEPLPLPQESCYTPVISGDYVVYYAENYRTDPYPGATYCYPYICAYNLSTGISFAVAAGQVGYVPMYISSPRAMSSPAVDGPIIAWVESSGWNVGVKNVKTGTAWGSGVGGPGAPDVSGPYVVYQGIINYNWDIYLYDTSSEETYAVTTNAANQENPAISATEYANFIVYQDNRNGNWAIYLTGFWFNVMGGVSKSAPPITPSNVIGHLQEVKSIVVDTPTSDFAGANDKVRENRKNVMIRTLDSAIVNIEDAVNTQNLNVRKANLQCSINQLYSLIDKVDGWSLRESADTPGSGFTPDWITAPLFLDQFIKPCRNDLQILLDGITK